MTPVELSRTVLHAVHRAVDEGELSVSVPARVVVERARPGGCGDYATGIALQLARPAGRPARQVAELLRQRLLGTPGVAGVEITGPGFLNITVDGGRQARALLREILDKGLGYGHAAGGSTTSGGDVAVHLDVGPGARAAVLGDAVGRILRSQGRAVRVSYEGGAGPEPAWVALGVSPAPAFVDADAPVRHRIRPVPSPADPVPLGSDAARWALLSVAGHDRPRISGDHLVQRESNPLFRVRYAYARIRALVRNAADLGFASDPGDIDDLPAVSGLLAALAEYPRVLATAARHLAPDRLARHLVLTADTFLRFQEAARILPLGDEKPSADHRARLALAEGTGTVLAGGLKLLGIDAPDTI